MTALYDEALAPVGVNLAQFSLMRSISWQQPVSLTDLARVVELDRSTVGRNTRVLERMGLLAITTGQDQREAVLALTDDGRDILTRGAPLWDGVQDGIETRLGSERTKQLQDLLADL